MKKYALHYLNKLKTMPREIYILLAIAFILRFIGLTYGLPLQINTDEPVLISTTVNLKYNLNPDRFDWPHLYYYINAVAYGIFFVLREALSFIHRFEILYEDSSLFVVSRLLSVMFGTLTVIPVYYFAKKLFDNKQAGLIAAIILTFLPIHVSESHLAKLDIAQTFFIAVAFYFAAKIYYTNRFRDYIYFGIITGLATSIKYNGVLIYLTLLIAMYFHAENIREFIKPKNLLMNIKNLLAAGVSTVIAFYLGTPFALIEYKKFFSNERAVGAMWQFENVGKIDWIDYPGKLLEVFGSMYRENLGLSLWIVFVLFLLAYLFFKKRNNAYNITAFSVLFFSFYITRFERSPDHYYFFLIPLYAAFLGSFISEIIEYSKRWNFAYTKYIIVGLILSTSIFESIKFTYYYSRRDTRNLAYDWVKQNINEEFDSLYVYGDEIEQIPFQKNRTERVKKIDRAHFREFVLPYYVLVGVSGVSPEAMLNGDRDPKNVEGDSEPILKYAEVKKVIDNNNRFGPPIYIFKVTEVRN